MLLLLGTLTLAAWLYLSLFRGPFWSANIPPRAAWRPPGELWPSVLAVIPARNEADVIGDTVAAILRQDYPGDLRLVVVNDHSEDATAEATVQAAQASGTNHAVRVLDAPPLPEGWTGKVWALRHGVEEAQPDEPLIWLTDADIQHAPDTLRSLVARAEGDCRDLVSRMALLHTRSIWEKLMIPAFVYFFQLLYPFAWSNDSQRRTAAAAGGCVLVRRKTLEAAGGLQSIRNAVIDDCALAAAIQAAGGSLWLELTKESVSARGYDGLNGLWNMIARTAYTQLGYQPALLAGCVLGLGITFAAPPLVTLFGLGLSQPATAATAGLSWLLMTLTFAPMVRFYFPRQPLQAASAALALPLTALLYLGAAIHSAIRYHRGAGAQWKGRAQAG